MLRNLLQRNEHVLKTPYLPIWAQNGQSQAKQPRNVIRHEGKTGVKGPLMISLSLESETTSFLFMNTNIFDNNCYTEFN